MRPQVPGHQQMQRVSTRHQSRGGFTLLELLLTSLLSAVLLAGLWSLFNTYMRLFETGQVKTEQSQLVRALAQQLADDLRSVTSTSATAPAIASSSETTTPVSPMQTSPLEGTRSASTLPLAGRARGISTGTSTSVALPRFGLIGTSRTLKLEVLQASPAGEATTSAHFMEETDHALRTATVPELRTILYAFEEPREVRETDRKAPPGLTRVDLDWREFADLVSKSSRTTRNTPSGGTEAQLAEAVESLGLTRTEGLVSLPANSSIHVPEVTRCSFRYFDGSDWLDEWDSNARKSLPSAVEVTLLLSPPPERWRPRARKENNSGTEDSSAETVSDNNTETLDDGAELHRPLFRQVIALPATPNARTNSSEFAAPSSPGFRSSRLQGLSRGGAR